MGEIQQDPSMEEILASIKRVIAEDGRSAGAASMRGSRRPPPRPEPLAERPAMEVEEQGEDVLELDDPVGEEGLISAAAAASSREKLAALTAARDRGETAGSDGALEAVVRDMLRPLLKEWLDQHLPEIIEALVAREIARITGRSL